MSTGTTWQYLNNGMIGQHLAANHPVGTRAVFLTMLNKVIEKQDRGSLNTYQIYYRPQNKYPNRLFETLAEKTGQDLAEIIRYNYFEVPLLKQDNITGIEITEIKDGGDDDFIRFVQRQRSALFVKTQELDSNDLNLNKLNDKFQKYGLKRKRSIFVAKSCRDNRIYGAVIVNEGSLGLNFSFFENSTELILCKHSLRGFLLQVASKLLYQASQVHAASPLPFLPLMTDPLHTWIIEKLNGTLTRNYNLFMALKDAHEMWYEHVKQLTDAVYQRFTSNKYEKSY